MIEWRHIPWPLWGYAGVTLLGTARFEVEAHGPIGIKVLFVPVMIAWLYFLFRGVRWIWVVTIAIYVFGLGSQAISGSRGWQGVILVGLVLLVLSVTQRFFYQPHCGGEHLGLTRASR